jgi:hypothetical protein
MGFFNHLDDAKASAEQALGVYNSAWCAYIEGGH